MVADATRHYRAGAGKIEDASFRAVTPVPRLGASSSARCPPARDKMINPLTWGVLVGNRLTTR